MARLFNIKTRKRAAIGRRRISQLSAANAETSNETPPSAEYRVGYGRPPPWTQFKPKKSGNPKGRPKATSRKQGSIAQETLEKKLATTKNDGARKSLRQLAFERIGEKASSGDIKSVNFLLARENEEQQLAPDQFPVSTETALDIMRAYFERERASKEDGDKS
jgi:Family of unknown function (DUF5681)